MAMSPSTESHTHKVLISPSSISYASVEAKETALGEGGFGIVKKGVFDGKPVAVKKFIIDQNGDEDVMTKATFFIAEAKNMRQMHHPRIVKFMGFIMEELSIVMEFMEYGNLEDYIAKNLEMKWSQRFIFMMDIAEGMNYLHSKVDADGKSKQVIFHQDLKSANVLLGIEDGVLRGKISDFGFSIMKEKTANSQNSTLQSAVAHVGGTRIYMAPELFQTTMFTKECDVYSFGVILMELITMLPPVDAVRDYKMKLSAMQKVPVALKELTDKSLDLTPKKRPSFHMIMKSLLDARLYIENCTAPALKTANEQKPPKFDMSLYASSMFERSTNRTQFRKKDEDDETRTKGYFSRGDSSNPASRDCCHLFPVKREKRLVVLIAILVLVIFIVAGIVIGVLLTRPSFTSSPPASSVQFQVQTSATPTPTPTQIVEQIDWTKVSNVGGANYPTLYALGEENQLLLLKDLSRTNSKLIRIIIRRVEATGAFSALPDVEPATTETYDDTILLAIDKLMWNAYRYGFKLVVAFHDRYSLGCFDKDAYTLQFQLPSSFPSCTLSNSNDPHLFYKDTRMVQAYDNRIKYILSHRNAYFNDRPWKELTEVIYGFDIQNQPQAKTSQFNADWMCARASLVRSLVSSGIRVATGGGGDIYESLRESYFNCSSIHVVGMSVFSSDFTEIYTGLNNASALASRYSKTIVLEAFGSISGKSAFIKSVASFANKFAIPWMVWKVSTSTNSTTHDFSADDTSTWSSLRMAASDALNGDKTVYYPPSMQKGDWEFCSINEECKNQCCSNIYSNDNKMKCTTGTSKCGYFESDGLIRDWQSCSRSADCSNKCCSDDYSDDGKLKCTPGGTKCI